MTQRDVVFVLVHGTFAPAAQWVHAGNSLLRTAVLDACPGATIWHPPFKWTGIFGTGLNNGHRYRVRAGSELRVLVKKIVEDNPCARVFLIGHSHGGNACLYAAQDPEIQAHLAGIVTMATPFFVVTGRGTVAGAFHTVWIFLASLFVFGGSIVLPMLVLVSLALTVNALFSLHGPASWLVGIIVIPVGLVLGLLLNVLLPGVWSVLSRSFDGFVRTSERAAQSALQSTLPTSVPVLCVLADRDEFRRLFFVVDSILGVLRSGWGLMLWICASLFAEYRVLTLVYGRLVAPMSLEFRAYAPADSALFWIACAGFLAIVATAVAASLVVLYAGVDTLLSRLRVLVHGWEGFPDTLFSLIASSPVPTGHDALVGIEGLGLHEISRPYSVRSRIAHCGLYEDPTALSHITRWISRSVTAELADCPACASAVAETPGDHESPDLPGVSMLDVLGERRGSSFGTRFSS